VGKRKQSRIHSKNEKSGLTTRKIKNLPVRVRAYREFSLSKKREFDDFMKIATIKGQSGTPNRGAASPNRKKKWYIQRLGDDDSLIKRGEKTGSKRIVARLRGYGASAPVPPEFALRSELGNINK